jgi:hypothetical protein
MKAIFQMKFRWALWTLGAHFLFAVVVLAMEIDQIMPAKATEPSCSNPMEYFELDRRIPPMATKSRGICDSCKSTLKSAVESANGTLAAAKAQNASINASTAAGTAGTAAGVNPLQDRPQFATRDVNSAGQTAATQQSGLANGVTEGFESCAKQIESSCQQGQLAPEDYQAAKSSADSCRQSAQQARQVAADKALKADEMAKNGQQANQNGQGMQPPQMPLGGAGGSPGLGSSDPLDSKVSSNIDLAKGLKLDTKINSGKAEIPLGQGSESGLSSEANTATTSSGGSNSLGSSKDSGSHTAADANSSSGGGNSGFSGSGSMGSLGSSGASKSSEEKVEHKTSAENGAVAAAGSSGGGARPTLGLRSSGDELSDLLNQNAPEGAATIGGGPMENLASNRNLASNSSMAEETSLFKRVKTKITRVSRDQHMQ